MVEYSMMFIWSRRFYKADGPMEVFLWGLGWEGFLVNLVRMGRLVMSLQVKGVSTTFSVRYYAWSSWLGVVSL